MLRVLRRGGWVLGAVLACRRTGPAPVPVDAEAAALDALPDAPALALCAAGPPRWIVRGTAASDDAGAQLGYESVEVAGERALLTDARTGRVTLVRTDSGPEASLPLGGEHSDPRLVSLVGTTGPVPLVAWVRQSLAGRHHVVRVGPRLDRGCEQPEGRDEGLSLAAATTTRGALLVWDEDGPAPAAGHILAQVVAPSEARPVGPLGVAGGCPAPRQISPPEQDASDPVAVRLGDGAAVFWLAGRDVSGGEEHNETVTDLWGVALSPAGVVRGAPLRLTRGPGHRFGIALASAEAGTVWVAWRNAPDSDSESRGDGGEVALARVTATPGGLGRVDRTAVVNEPGGVPTGAPVIAIEGTRVSVWWRDRREGRVVTMRRPVDATGQPDPAGPRVEPAADGALVHGSLAVDPGPGVGLLRPGPGGGLGVVRLRCP